LPSTPVTGTLEVDRDGQSLFETDDWTLSGTTLTMVTAPSTGSKIRVKYQRTVTSAGNANTVNGLSAEDYASDGKLVPYRGGWQKINATWTYSSVDDPTGIISFDNADDYLTSGMRIQFTNGGNTIYGIVTVVTSTTFTFLHEIDPSDNLALVLMANSAITDPMISHVKAPQGFPLDPRKWSVQLVDTTDRVQTNVTAKTYYNIGSLSISIPIGLWKLSMECLIGMHSQNTSGQGQFQASLSTSTSSVSNAKLLAGSLGYIYTATARVKASAYMSDIVALTSKTTYYPIITSIQNVGTTDIGFYNASAVNDIYKTMVVKAECAYL